MSDNDITDFELVRLNLYNELVSPHRMTYRFDDIFDLNYGAGDVYCLLCDDKPQVQVRVHGYRQNFSVGFCYGCWKNCYCYKFGNGVSLGNSVVNKK